MNNPLVVGFTVWFVLGFINFIWLSVSKEKLETYLYWTSWPGVLISLLIKALLAVATFFTIMTHGCLIACSSPAKFFIYTRNPFKIGCIKKRIRSKPYLKGDSIWYHFYAPWSKYKKDSNELIKKIRNGGVSDTELILS